MFNISLKKSQLNQDLWIMKLYGEQRKGFFVEVGSTDGTNLSNTYLLEKGLGWKGICIDADPNQWESLQKERDCIVSNDCVWSKSGEEVPYLVQSCYSGIESHTEKKNYPNEDGVVDYTETIKLKTKTLNDILKENNAPEFIEYISIDTEGSELEVLKGINFEGKYTIGAFTIEHNHDENRKEEIKKYLEDNGYERFAEVGWEDWYSLRTLYKHLL
ncbi:methyltransferase [Candidatus Pacearchaeota archaeon]|nr:methyltransferase [Candidatus Pacearchaeota archaeon]|tara:strand:- start:6455 stop:7102 length:648 start_codon:yes stop_codon:yes gene_type:complete